MTTPFDDLSFRMSIEAENQSGKTAFLLTMPKPMALFAFDLGWKRALVGRRWPLFKDLNIEVKDYEAGKPASPDEFKGHDVIIYQLPEPIQTDPVAVTGAIPLWNYFNERMAMVLRTPEMKSAAVDTATVARKVRADAHLEGLQMKNKERRENLRERLQQIEYAKPNEAITDLYTAFEIANKNLIMAHHVKPEMKEVMETDPRTNMMSVKQVRTGDMILDGLAKTHNLVDVAMYFKGENRGGEFLVDAKFLKCGFVPELRGTSMTSPTWNSLANWMSLKLGSRLTFQLWEGMPDLVIS